MSTLRVDDTDKLLDLAAADSGVEPCDRLHSPDAVRIVSATGQAAVVLLAVLVPCVGTRPVTPAELLALCLTAGVWLAMVRGAFAAWHDILGIWPSAVLGSSAGLVAVIALGPALPGRPPAPHELLGMTAGVLASAAVWEWAVCRSGARRRRVLVVGTDELSNDLAEELARAEVDDFHLIGRVGEKLAGGSGCGIPFAGVLADLTAIVEAQRPDLIVLTDERSYGRAVDHLLDGPRTGARVVGLAGFFEHALGRVPVRQLTPAWFMSLVHLRQPVYGRWTKRAFDVAATLVGLLIALPVMAAIALVVGRTAGPLFYQQTRLGEGGRPFTMYKFRTMVVDAEQIGQPRFACEHDPRVIPGGGLVRRTHLDELPQLWNVLVGDMSIVGPRPERPEFAAPLEEAVPFWQRRLLIKPGITGWAQVNCGYVADCEGMADKLAYDLWYVRNRSLALDVAICLRTIGLQFRALLPCASAVKGVDRQAPPSAVRARRR
jgi:exopolysaccharide biosynthesis polyprenyl glycosylphosphotransferase